MRSWEKYGREVCEGDIAIANLLLHKPEFICTKLVRKAGKLK